MTSARKQLENLRAFLDEGDAEAEQMLAAAETAMGHPANWPRPPRDMPRWYQLATKRRLREVSRWFGPIAQDDLDAFYAEARKGQSVYEDAGGYMLRCYRALLALSVEEPYTYEQAFADLCEPPTSSPSAAAE